MSQTDISSSFSSLETVSSETSYSPPEEKARSPPATLLEQLLAQQNTLKQAPKACNVCHVVKYRPSFRVEFWPKTLDSFGNTKPQFSDTCIQCLNKKRDESDETCLQELADLGKDHPTLSIKRRKCGDCLEVKVIARFRAIEDRDGGPTNFTQTCISCLNKATEAEDRETAQKVRWWEVKKVSKTRRRREAHQDKMRLAQAAAGKVSKRRSRAISSA